MVLTKRAIVNVAFSLSTVTLAALGATSVLPGAVSWLSLALVVGFWGRYVFIVGNR